MNEAWVKFVLFLGGIVFLFLIVEFILKRLFGLKGINAYEFVNETHKYMDWAVRLLAIGLAIVAYVMEWLWFMQSGLFFILTIIVPEIIRAIMQYKYADHRNLYKHTVSHLVLLFGVYVVLIYSLKVNWFGLS